MIAVKLNQYNEIYYDETSDNEISGDKISASSQNVRAVERFSGRRFLDLFNYVTLFAFPSRYSIFPSRLE